MSHYCAQINYPRFKLHSYRILPNENKPRDRERERKKYVMQIRFYNSQIFFFFSVSAVRYTCRAPIVPRSFSFLWSFIVVGFLSKFNYIYHLLSVRMLYLIRYALINIQSEFARAHQFIPIGCVVFGSGVCVCSARLCSCVLAGYAECHPNTSAV